MKTSFAQQSGKSEGAASRPTSKVRRTVVTRVHEAVKAIALCHNVTPVYEVRLFSQEPRVVFSIVASLTPTDC